MEKIFDSTYTLYMYKEAIMSLFGFPLLLTISMFAYILDIFKDTFVLWKPGNLLLAYFLKISKETFKIS